MRLALLSITLCLLFATTAQARSPWQWETVHVPADGAVLWHSHSEWDRVNGEDLLFSVRLNGREVRYEPKACVVYFTRGPLTGRASACGDHAHLDIRLANTGKDATNVRVGYRRPKGVN